MYTCPQSMEYRSPCRGGTRQYILSRAREAGSPLNPPSERRQGTPLDPLARLNEPTKLPLTLLRANLHPFY